MHLDPNETRTAEQYRNERRQARYAAKLSIQFNPHDHALRARRGTNIITTLHCLIRKFQRTRRHRFPQTY